MIGEKVLWHIEVRQTQVFNHNSTRPGSRRDFNYDFFVDTELEEGARKSAEARLFWTAEKFAEVYWEDDCPPAKYFSLECKILTAKREQVDLARLTPYSAKFAGNTCFHPRRYD